LTSEISALTGARAAAKTRLLDADRSKLLLVGGMFLESQIGNWKGYVGGAFM
jgi:hypothetical protein